MSILTRHPSLRWLAPAAAVVILLGGGAAIRGIAGSAATVDAASLPGRTAAELVADVAAAPSAPWPMT